MTAGIAPDFVAAVLAHVAARPAAHAALTLDLRAHFPGVHISVCGEDDVSPRVPPAGENAACLIYYVAAGDHCLSLTNDAAAATGIAVALREAEDA
ncbi:MAG: DUF6129 family protein [Pseudomonadota bacterium]